MTSKIKSNPSPQGRPSKSELLMAEFMAEQELVSLIREAVSVSGIDRQEVASRLGVHRSGITKVLNKPRNMSVRMAARILRSVGRRLYFRTEECSSQPAQDTRAYQHIFVVDADRFGDRCAYRSARVSTGSEDVRLVSTVDLTSATA